MNEILMIFWTNDHNIEWIIWFFKKIVDHVCSKNSILVDFLGNRNGASAGWNGYLSLKNQQKVTDTKPWLTAQNLD